MPYVSIIMPAYNAEKTVSGTIASVLEQTFRDFELIIIDDGSYDDTCSICRNAAQNDDRIKFIHKGNGGVSSARNKGLADAKGEYIAFIDSDDTYDKTYLEKMAAAAKAKDADMVICGYNTIVKQKCQKKWLPDNTDDEKEFKLRLLNKSTGLNTLWNKLYRRSLIDNNFNLSVSMGEDLEFICDFVVRCRKFAVVMEALYNYTFDTSNSLTKKTELLLNSITHDIGVLKKYSEKAGINSDITTKKLYGRTENILGNIEKYKNFKIAVDYLLNNKEYLALLDLMKPTEEKNKLLSFMIKRDKPLLLYLYLSVKRVMRRIFKR